VLTTVLPGYSVLKRSLQFVRCRAPEVLPGRLEAGLLHGDYAPRNLLVNPGGQIAGFDTRALYFGPSYEDIGFFLWMMRFDSQGFYFPRIKNPHRERLQQAFLNGYFLGGAVPTAALSLFELQAIEKKWAVYARAFLQASKGKRICKWMRFVFWSPFFQRHVAMTIEQLEESGGRTKDARLWKPETQKKGVISRIKSGTACVQTKGEQ
jgi:hypothetical protein